MSVDAKSVGPKKEVISYQTDKVTTTNRSKEKVQQANIKAAENKDTVSISTAGKEKATGAKTVASKK
ncbi:MAG: hypothetical protein HQK91_01170 [Nitrospirae bacterium]|nr:hypothetical protein [Nitrospirota bacterium]MBF0540047.1 hypothetical protein [Nitrospirota bacterium]